MGWWWLGLGLCCWSAARGQDCDGAYTRWLNHDVVGAAQPLVTRSTASVDACKELCQDAGGSCAAFLFEQHAFIRTATCRMFRTNLKTAPGHVHLKPKVPNSFPKFHYFEPNTTCLSLKESGGLEAEEIRKAEAEEEAEGLEAWGSWSKCTASCGGGLALRVRICRNCERGNEIERRPCSLRPCFSEPESFVIAGREVVGSWSAWAAWGRCFSPCEGSQTRSRTCYVGAVGCASRNATNLLGETERRECRCRDFDFRTISNALWVSWGRWSECERGCEGGERIRDRQCTVPLACNGTYAQRQSCVGRLECKESVGSVVSERLVTAATRRTTTQPAELTTAVPPSQRWTEWRRWSACTRTCGAGTQIRTRACPGGQCPGRFSQTQVCQRPACPTESEEVLEAVLKESGDGGWRLWGAWEACARTCGTGTRTRRRTCRDGEQCFGSATDTELCSPGPCATDAPEPTTEDWSTWSTWSPCTVSCGEGGLRSRRRRCGGRSCGPGRSSEARPCPVVRCPAYFPWGEWSDCSRSCDSGTRVRSRECDGDRCEGPSRDAELCGTEECPRPPRWSDWSPWSDCSRSCDSGTRTRRRACDEEGGCVGSAIDVQVCNVDPCPAPSPPAWSLWEAWSSCTATCGDATRTRSRACTSTDSANGNVTLDRPGACRGLSADRQLCLLPDCGGEGEVRAREGPEEGETGSVWGPWGDWASCSATCGRGIRGRQRRCMQPPCLGDPIMGESCILRPCSLTAGVKVSQGSGWSSWNSWSSCSATCGDTATKFRSRFCQQSGECPRELEAQEIPCIRLPACRGEEEGAEKLKEEDGAETGSSEEELLVPRDLEEEASEEAEEVVWGPWVEWANCSCDTSTRSRRRLCLSGPCPLADAAEEEACEGDDCLAKGPWGSWKEWTPCSETCGNGIRVRERECPARAICRGRGFQSSFCNLRTCPRSLDSQGWSEWHAWSQCFSTFGPGNVEKIRIRVCPEGRWCPGPSFETTQCANSSLPFSDAQVLQPPL